MALRALADIAPTHADVQNLMEQSLVDANADIRFFAAYGVGLAESSSEEGQSRLAANLKAADPYLVEISAWAIGKLGNLAEQASPDLLDALKRFHWMQIEPSESSNEEFISIRPVIRDALQRALPATDDPDYEDFRLRFFYVVFHPTPLEKTSWIDEIVNHRWYLKLQRRRFGHPASAEERKAIRQMVCEAQAKLASRLWKNPTLGVHPECYKLLPGFIKNHCRNIAWRLQEQIKKSRREKTVPEPRTAFAPLGVGSSDETARRICEFIETFLPEEEREVARCRWALKLTIEETASLLDISISQVKTRERHARAAAQHHYEQGKL
jgi:Sigma-70, region 4